MREQLTIPPKVLQEYLEAACIHGISEKEAKDLIEEKYLDRWEKNSLFPSVKYQVQKVIAALSVMDNDWRQRERRNILESLYEQYILGEGIDSGSSVVTLSSPQEPDSDEPRIFHTLSPEGEFYDVRQFFQSLEVADDKLVWPDSEKGGTPLHERWGRNHLPLLILHLVQEKGFLNIEPNFQEIHQFLVVPYFLWNDKSEITARDSRSKLGSIQEHFPSTLDLKGKHNRPVWHLIASFSSRY